MEIFFSHVIFIEYDYDLWKTTRQYTSASKFYPVLNLLFSAPKFIFFIDEYFLFSKFSFLFFIPSSHFHSHSLHYLFPSVVHPTFFVWPVIRIYFTFISFRWVIFPIFSQTYPKSPSSFLTLQRMRDELMLEKGFERSSFKILGDHICCF